LILRSFYERSLDCERRIGSSLFDSFVIFFRRSDGDAGTTAFCELCESWDRSKRRRNEVLITVCANGSQSPSRKASDSSTMAMTYPGKQYGFDGLKSEPEQVRGIFPHLIDLIIRQGLAVIQ